MVQGDNIKPITKKIKRCPLCGNYMEHHIFGERVYWTCHKCKNGMMTSKNAEIIAGHILE